MATRTVTIIHPITKITTKVTLTGSGGCWWMGTALVGHLITKHNNVWEGFYPVPSMASPQRRASRIYRTLAGAVCGVIKCRHEAQVRYEAELTAAATAAATVDVTHELTNALDGVPTTTLSPLQKLQTMPIMDNDARGGEHLVHRAADESGGNRIVLKILKNHGSLAILNAFLSDRGLLEVSTYISGGAKHIRILDPAHAAPAAPAAPAPEPTPEPAPAPELAPAPAPASRWAALDLDPVTTVAVAAPVASNRWDLDF